MTTVTRPIALVGLPYLPYRHTLYMLYVNITPHVCKGLEAIWAYIACALLAQLAAGVLINTWSLSYFIRYENSFRS